MVSVQVAERKRAVIKFPHVLDERLGLIPLDNSHLHLVQQGRDLRVDIGKAERIDRLLDETLELAAIVTRPGREIDATIHRHQDARTLVGLRYCGKHRICEYRGNFKLGVEPVVNREYDLTLVQVLEDERRAVHASGKQYAYRIGRLSVFPFGIERPDCRCQAVRVAIHPGKRILDHVLDHIHLRVACAPKIVGIFLHVANHGEPERIHDFLLALAVENGYPAVKHLGVDVQSLHADAEPLPEWEPGNPFIRKLFCTNGKPDGIIRFHQFHVSFTAHRLPP